MNKQEERFYRLFSYVIMPALVGVPLKVRAEGAENVPQEGAFLLAGNHRSWTDPLLIAMEIPRPVHFLAASFNFQIPIANWVFKKAAVMPLHLGGKKKNEATFRKCIELMEQGEAVGIFPEGVQNFLNPSREKVKKFQTGFVRLAIAAGTCILPVAIAGKREVVMGRTGHPLLKALLTLGRSKEDFLDLTMLVYVGGVGIAIGKPISLDEYYHLDYSKESLNHIAGRVRRETINLYAKAKALAEQK